MKLIMAILESPNVDCREHGRLVVDKWGMRPGRVGVELRHHVLLLLELPLVLLKELRLSLPVLMLISEIQALSRLEDLQERLFKRALLIDRQWRIVKLTTHTKKNCFLQIRSSKQKSKMRCDTCRHEIEYVDDLCVHSHVACF